MSHLHKNLIVYKNEKKQNIKLKEYDVVAFTSPMNVDAYFENMNSPNKQKFIVIGESTAKALLQLGIKCISNCANSLRKKLG